MTLMICITYKINLKLKCRYVEVQNDDVLVKVGEWVWALDLVWAVGDGSPVNTVNRSTDSSCDE